MEPDRAARFYRFNDAVLKAIASDVLRPAVVSADIDGFLDHLLPANVESRVEDLRRQRRALDTKIQNLTAAVEGGADLPSVIALLSERQKERDALISENGLRRDAVSDSRRPRGD